MNYKYLIGVLVLAAVPLVGMAAQFKTGERVSFTEAISTSADVYLAGGTVHSSSDIVGDLIVGGGSIVISSNVSADTALAGGEITVTGDVGDDLRAVGGNIVLSGDIAGDAIIAGGQANLSGGSVGGDVLWGGGTLSIDEPISGNVKAAGAELFINNTVSGNVEFVGDSLVLGQNARIQGALSYQTPKEAEISDAAIVAGEITHTLREQVSSELKERVSDFVSIGSVVLFLAFLLVALAMSTYFKNYMERIVVHVVEQPLKEFGRGVLVVIALPIVSIVLMLTAIGLYFGVVGLIAFVALLVFGPIVAAIMLGSVVYKHITKDTAYVVSLKSTSLGVVLYTVLGAVPMVGWIAACVLVAISLGALIRAKWNIVQSVR